MNQPPSMNQMIFQSTLSKEAISAYLLCCALTDEGRAITTSALSEVWNSSDARLQESLDALAAANVIQQIVSDGEDQAGYQLVDPHRWQLPK